MVYPAVTSWFISSKLYIGIVTSKSSALLINVPLIFEMQLINGALFLKEIPLIRFLVSLATSLAALTAAVLAVFLASVICSAVLPGGKILLGKRLSGKSSAP